MLMPNSAPDLREAAAAVRENAYAPYSNFKVGASMRAGSGKIYISANVDNVWYPVGTCAKEAALAAMIVAGETEVIEPYVIADSPESVPPCGARRQRLKEFGKDDVTVWMGTKDGKKETTTLGDLLPVAFDAGYMARS